MIDICFCCTPKEFARQIRGGLDENRIHNIYDNKRNAENIAKWLLANQ